MSPFESLGRVSVAKTVIAQIRSAMEAGEIRRGDRLPPEPELANRLHVSRGSLREALKILEVLGILEVRRGSGTYVAQHPRLPDTDPLLFLLLLQDGSRDQLVELRFMVEVGFTQLAQGRMTEDRYKSLEASIEDLEAAVLSGSVGPEHDLSFHRLILDATDNPFVIQVGTAVLELFRDSIGKGVREFPRYAVDHHREILSALRSGDPQRIEEAIRRSFEVWKDLVGSS